jgi:Ni,Fe-hydrogenase III large subunit/Ni,Fe-hydrogenase III component G
VNHPLMNTAHAWSAAGRRRIAIDTDPRDLPASATALLAAGYRLALAGATHIGAQDPRGESMHATYLFLSGPPDSRIELRVALDPAEPRVPSLAALSFPAGRFEREMHDQYGVTPTGHPLPRPLIRHPAWPEHWHPMRADAGPRPPLDPEPAPFPFLTVQGPGVYEIPVGPVHAGLIEPGHFRFSVVGETILKLKARLWYVHKGIEKLFEHHDPATRLPLAERVSGDTAVGHALAYTRALEDAADLDVPHEAEAARALLLELERLHNHAADLGALCNDVGHSILNAHAQRVRESLLRLNAETTGHRLLRGAIIPGGVRLLSVPDPQRLLVIAADVGEIVDLALGHSVVRDRFTGTSVLTRDQAADLGALGYVARASGLDTDARRQHPAHPDLPAPPTTLHSGGDVLARFIIRAEEFQASVDYIGELARLLPGRGPLSIHAEKAARGGPGTGVGIAEGWRGTIVHRIETAPDGTLDRVKIVDPSFMNWPALPVALAGAIVPDFPLTNKSFNLSYAGNDL